MKNARELLHSRLVKGGQVEAFCEECLTRTLTIIKIRKTRYVKHTIRGVPGRLCDVLLPEAGLRTIPYHLQGTTESRGDKYQAMKLEVSDLDPPKLPPALQDCLVEVGEKFGKYDAAKRRRYVFRNLQYAATQDGSYQSADLSWLCAEEGVAVMLHDRYDDSTPIYVGAHKRLEMEIGDRTLNQIMQFHWRRFYTHLTSSDVIKQSHVWEAGVKESGESQDWTLNCANRAASRELYRISRMLGWKKLTLRDKERYGLDADSPQWQREGDIEAKNVAARVVDAQEEFATLAESWGY